MIKERKNNIKIKIYMKDANALKRRRRKTPAIHILTWCFSLDNFRFKKKKWTSMGEIIYKKQD